MPQHEYLLGRIAELELILRDTHSPDVRRAIEGAIGDCRRQLETGQADEREAHSRGQIAPANSRISSSVNLSSHHSRRAGVSWVSNPVPSFSVL